MERNGQFFVKQDKEGAIKIIIAKVTDNILIPESSKHMYEFTKKIKKRFSLRNVVIDKLVMFNGHEITREAHCQAQS